MCNFFDIVVFEYERFQFLCEGVNLGYKYIFIYCIFVLFFFFVVSEMNMSIAIKSYKLFFFLVFRYYGIIY